MNLRTKYVISAVLVIALGSGLVVGVIQSSRQHLPAWLQARPPGYRYGFEIGRNLSRSIMPFFGADYEIFDSTINRCWADGHPMSTSWIPECKKGVNAGIAVFLSHSAGSGSASITGTEIYCFAPVARTTNAWRGLVELTPTTYGSRPVAIALVTANHLSFTLRAKPGRYDIYLNGSNSSGIPVTLTAHETNHLVVEKGYCAL